MKVHHAALERCWRKRFEARQVFAFFRELLLEEAAHVGQHLDADVRGGAQFAGQKLDPSLFCTEGKEAHLFAKIRVKFVALTLG